MKDYCLSRVQEGRHIFPCPASNCKRVWEYFLVRHVACFDDATRSDIEKRVTEHYIAQGRGFQQCPGCNMWCFPANTGDLRLRCPACSVGKKYDFCWACQNEWKNTGSLSNCGNEGCDGKDPRLRILAKAEKMPIDNIPGCPSIRACPKCGMLINLRQGCRHVACRTCGTDFCFICLKRWRSEIDNRTISSRCPIAPVQTTLIDRSWEQGNNNHVVFVNNTSNVNRPNVNPPSANSSEGGCVIL